MERSETRLQAESRERADAASLLPAYAARQPLRNVASPAAALLARTIGNHRRCLRSSPISSMFLQMKNSELRAFTASVNERGHRDIDAEC